MQRLSPICLLALAMLAFFSPAVRAATPPMRADKLGAIDAAMSEAIAAKKMPGGVVWLERDGAVYRKAYGQRALVPAAEPATEDTIYDVASLTKVIVTTTGIMQLVEQRKIELDAPAAKYLPAFAQNDKGAITVRQLMTHHSGLRAGLDRTPAWSGYAAGIRLAMAEKPRSLPGSTFVYSDINFIVLGEIVRVVSGRTLDRYAAEEIFGPLRMVDTSFLPTADKVRRIAPTEAADGKMLRGLVHDPTARAMGGVAGNAGVFSTAADLARFCRMLLGGGQLDGVRILSAASVAEMTRAQTDGSDRRGLGWDIDSRYSSPRGRWFPAGASYGHTGFTGPTLWLDPGARTFYVLMCNRVHPDGKGDVVALRRTLATLGAEAVGRDVGAVLNGIDVLVRDDFAQLRGLRVGLITNQSGRDRDGRATIDLLHAAKGVKLVALFAPEHGIRGAADTTVSDTLDAATGLPIYSLYGDAPPRPAGQSAADRDMAVIRARAPKPEQLRDIDALVFDIQDIGARFYTYSATLGAALEAAAQTKKKFIVLDRVNPIGGAAVEGPVMTRPPSFVGFHPLPVRHGMTLGELAKMFNAERRFGADLTVIACENWARDQYLDQTGLPWTNPSPSMQSLTAATLYPGLCLLEGDRTQVSMARGTDKPFEQVGAPFIDGVKLAGELNRAGIKGVRIEPVRFTPRAELYPGPASQLKYRDLECGGVRFEVTDRAQLNAVDLGIALALAMQKLYPEQFSTVGMERLVGDDATVADIKAQRPLTQIKAGWEARLAEFGKRRDAYLIYGYGARK